MWQQIQVEFHAGRERRVSEKEVRSTDGQILCRSMPRVCFLFNQTLLFFSSTLRLWCPVGHIHLPSAKSKKTQLWRETDSESTKRRRERGRSEERRGMRQKKGARCLCFDTKCSALFGDRKWAWSNEETQQSGCSRIEVVDEVFVSCRHPAEKLACLLLESVFLSLPVAPLVHPSDPPPSARTGRAVLQGSLALEEEGK